MVTNPFVDGIVVQRVMSAVAAGTTVQNSTPVLAETGCAFVLSVGAVTDGTTGSAKLQHGDESDGSDAVDVTDASVSFADGDSNKEFVLQKIWPTKKYYRVVVTRTGANVVINGITALVFGTRTKPVSQPATVKSVYVN